MPSLFQARDGLFHFVFANEDLYVTDSGVRLRLHRWLFRTLCDDYSYIFFVSGKKGKYFLTVFDRESWNKASEAAKRILPVPLRTGAEYAFSKEGSKLMISEESIRKLQSELHRAAFIFSVQVFAEFYRGREEFLEDLERINYQLRNVMLIRGPVSAAYNHDFFADRGSIFHGKTDRGYLFPEIVQAFCEEDDFGEGCFNRLKKIMGNSCVFLNTFTRASVKNVVWNAAWHADESLEKMDGISVRQVAEYAYLWHHSDEVQARWKDSFRQNDRHEFSVLLTDLSENWDAVMKNTKEFFEMYGNPGDVKTDIPEPGCVYESQLCSRLKSINIKRIEAEEGGFGLSEQIMLQRLIRMYMTDRPVMPGKETERTLRTVVMRMDRAAAEGDLRTFNCGCDCLTYAAEKSFSEDERFRKCLKGYELLSDICAAIYETESGNKVDEQRLTAFRSDFFSMMDDLKGGMPDGDAYGFKSKVDRADGLHMKVKLTKGLIKDRTQYLDALTSTADYLETMLRKVSGMREYSEEYAGVFRDLSGYMKDDPEHFLRSLMNESI